MSQDLHGRCALVTGAGRGIGRAIALALARRGAEVIVNDLHAAATDAVVAEVHEGGGGARAWAADVADEAAVRSLAARLEAEGRPCEILVNNAGIESSKAFLELTTAEWERQLRVNLSSMFHTCQALIPGMRATGYGRILNIASTAALRGGGLRGTAAYATAKAGVIGLTKALAREFAADGICAVALAPGYHETPMHDDIDPALRTRILASLPTGVAGDPTDLGEVVAFLASPHARFITGVVIPVDGGFTMY
jgi:3-oxoacyl-[acyl-carrier protein] reductase